MEIRMTRFRTARSAAVAIAAALLLPLAACATDNAAPAPTSTATTPISGEFDALETEFDAHLGVFGIDTGSDRTVEHRADERFAYASTSKALLAGAILATTAPADLEVRINYTSADLVANSPISEQHVADGMTLREVLDAALRYSDNTAANHMFARLGGPKGVERNLRALGDNVTQMDRTETALNEAIPGDTRDTSTPRALAADLRKYLLGSELTPEARAILTDMMRRNTTGGEVIRAGVPADWQVADKTGSAAYGTRNDIAVLWPPNRAPIVLTVLTTRAKQDASYDNALLAKAAKIAVQELN
ncbi:class A beta-lactamase [Nocardia sp. JCM 34519.1]|uniref:class A beta-lactamase n=1 Tax=unclassified Nocardia TaxID=2637762 RepID=UPI0035A94E36